MTAAAAPAGARGLAARPCACTTLSRMCGIVGYVGQQPACAVVMAALRRMEYRGYDSSGVALVNGDGTLTVSRRAGRLANPRRRWRSCRRRR